MNRTFQTFAILILIIVISSISFFGWLQFRNPYSGKKFDAEIWRSYAQSDDESNPRGPMTENLIENHLKIGIDRQSLTSLLGKEDSHQGQNCVGYTLGMWSGLMALDYDVLHICYDSSDKLISAKAYQH